jgi:hypothetical protein
MDNLDHKVPRVSQVSRDRKVLSGRPDNLDLQATVDWQDLQESTVLSDHLAQREFPEIQERLEQQDH